MNLRRLYLPGLVFLTLAANFAWGAITIDATTSRDLSAAAGTLTTPSFSTVSGNELLLAFIATDAVSGANTTVTSVSGAGLTWALVRRTNVQSGTSEIWRAFAPAQLSNVTVTATLSKTVVSSLTVMTFAGVDTSGTAGSGAIGATGSGNARPGAPTASLTTTRNGSWIVGVGNDYDRAASRSVGASQTLVHQSLPSIGDTYWVQMQSASTPVSGTVVTINDTAPTNDRYNLSICEILAASSGTQTWSISGTISPSGAGASVALTGASNATVTADPSGNFTFTGLANGTYTVSPTKPGFTFTPPSQTTTVNGANVTGLNFTAQPVPTWSISGTISPASSGAGASVALTGPSNTTVTADPSGNFTFTGLANGTYTVSPTKTGFTFTPPSQTVAVNGANVSGINFTAQPVPTWSISGTISPISSGAEATVALTGQSTATSTADSSGNFVFTGLANGSYTVTPARTGFTFTPPNQTATVNGANISGVTFTGQPSTWSISGTISPVSAGAGASLALSGAATAFVNADASGNYSFTGLANGAYTVTPGTAITHVGGKSATPTASAGVMTITYTPVHANDALIVFAGCRSGTATALSAAANGWTFTPITGLIGPSPFNDQGGAFGAITPNTTPTTITVTFTNGGDCISDTTILIDEFSGTDASGGITTFEAFNTSLDPNICTGAPVTPLSNNAAIWYGCYDNASGASGGYILAQDDGTGDRSEYKILSGGAGTPVNSGFTSTGVSSLLVGVAIKPASQSAFTFTPTSQNATINNANVTALNFTSQPLTWSISGTISPMSAGAGASVALSGAATATVTADASGNFSFTGLANGAYTVTPSRAGFTFTPTNQTTTVNGANVSGVNFTGQPLPTWSISGTISPSASGAGATVALTGQSTATVTADSSGNFSFTGLANGAYTVTPTRAGFTFTPTSQNTTVNGANVSGVNFTGQPLPTWSISGTISPAASGSGATVALTGQSTATATADSSGNFSFTGLANGTYTVTSSKSGYSFSPTSQNATVNGASVTGLSFTAQPVATISLVQKAVNGNESAGPNMSVAFPSNNTAGNFLIVTGTAARPATTITISDTAGNTYQPAIGPVTDTVQDITAYIWYVPNCKGGANTVKLTPSTSAALEIHVSEWSGIATTLPVDRTSSATGTGVTASSGTASTTMDGELVFGYTFLFNTAAAGTGFTGMSLVNGDLDEYQIQPTSGNVAATFTQTSGTWFALMATFRPAAGGPPPPTWSISGTIAPTSAGAGASVALTGTATASVIADASGNYSFTGLVNGTYTVTPAANGYSFTPTSQTATVNGANITGVNFTGQTATPGTLVLDVTVSRDGPSSSTSISTPSFSTASGNELLLAFIATDYTSGTNTTVKSISGGGLTWVLAVRTNVQSGTAEIWRAFSAAPLSNVTVTATLSQSISSSVTVMTFTGADTSGTNGAGAIGATRSGNAKPGAPTASLTTTRNGSWVVGVGNDYDNAIARTPGPSQQLVHQYLAPINDTYWVQRQTAPIPSSGTTVTINDTAPASDRYNLSICEILAASGTTTNPTPPTVSMTAPAPAAVVTNRSTLWAQASDTIGVAGVQFLLNGSALATEVTAPPYSITWDTTTVSDGSYTLTARARNTSGLTTTSGPLTLTVNNSGSPAVVGSWSPVVNVPTVAVNLMLLKDNKVLLYQDGASPTVWDYLNGTFTGLPTTADLFCSGHAMLADGRILVVGGFGGSGSSIGISNAEIFDSSNNTWNAVPNMSFRRWYPTATTLSDGRVLVTAGWQTSNHTNAGIPEIYNPVTNSWTQMTNANNPFETYPFIYQLPDGRVIHVGGSEYATVTDILDLNTQTWSVVDSNIVDGGSAVMFQPAKIMKAGSAADSQFVGPSSNTTFVLDMSQPSPKWQQTPSMAYPRSFLNLTTLPDGSVLATGGETDKDGGKIANAVYAAELWSQQTQTWTTMSSMHTPREYHGTAILLPDGRVLVSGMGADFGNVPDEMNAEFYSPPYLFKGARPTISQSPTQIQPATNFFVGTPDGAAISSVTLIRTGAVTHFFDQNTRYLPLSFQQTAGGLTVTAPANANLAPPGYYMLFIVNSAGVPSIAPIIQVQ